MTAVLTRPRTTSSVPSLEPACTSQVEREAEDTRHCPSCLTAEALAVLLAAADQHARADVWGVHSLITMVHALTAAAWETDGEVRSVDQLSNVTNELDGAIAVIDAVNHQTLDCMLMHAARSLLMAAKQMVDDEHSRLIRLPVGAAS